MNIYVYGYKSLTTKSINLNIEEIDDNLNKLLDDMLVTMRKANGCGLAANQVGIEKRFFVLEINGFSKKIINPEILEYGDSQCIMEEGCLSIPGIYKNVKRPENIKVKYLNEKKEEIVEVLDGMWARAFQHEYDHLDGVLFVEKIEPVAKSLIRKKLIQMKKNSKPRVFD